MTQEIIVVKYGSSSVSNDTGMDRERLAGYAADLAEARQRYGVVVVSSGSVAVGRCLWRQAEQTDRLVPSDRSLAMIGSGAAFTAWQEAFERHGLFTGQLPITHREVDDPTEGPSLLNALHENLAAGIVTVANENDALSDTELAKLSYGGDNDGLAAHLAIAVGAKALLLMTNRDGLLNGNRAVRRVGLRTSEWAIAYQYIEQAESSEGKGGMESKFNAASYAADAGVQAYIANASHAIADVLSGQIGTHFVAADIKR